MEKNLSQRTAYSSRLMLGISEAAVDLDRLASGIKTNLPRAQVVISLLNETLREYENSDSLIGIDNSSIWNLTLTTRLIPQIYGIDKSMPYRKEHFEAGLYFILEQLKDIENADPLRAEFARDIVIKLGNSLFCEKNVWWRNPQRRDLAQPIIY